MPVVNENRTILKTASGAQLIVAERTTLKLTGVLTDENGLVIPLAAIQTMTLTLYNRDSSAQEIINQVNAVSVLNTGRGTVNQTTGAVVLTLLPADNAIVNSNVDLEWHRVLLTGTYDSSKIGRAHV